MARKKAPTPEEIVERLGHADLLFGHGGTAADAVWTIG